jgi:3-oxoacyl-[acyl-carrier-protein] synthase II
MAMARRRVVVTGIGLVTPFGVGHQPFWSGLLAGESAISVVSGFDLSACSTPFGGEIPSEMFDASRFVGDRKRLRLMGRHAQLAISAAVLAAEDAKLDPGRLDPHRVGVFMGTSHDRTMFHETYGLLARLKSSEDSETLDLNYLWEVANRYSDPLFFLRTLPNGPAAHIAIHFNARGPNSTILTDGIASAQAIGDAARVIERGEADVMLAGGADSEINPEGVLLWELLGLLGHNRTDPARASRPFDRDRDGVVLGEGSGVLVLEALEHARARGASIYGELLGYGTATDGRMLPDEASEGDAICFAMEAASRDAGLPPESVGYLNAHGLASPLLDRIEARAIRRCFSGQAPPVSSIKGAIGYLNAAAPVVDLAACLLALRAHMLPPTINLENPDPEYELDHVANLPRPAKISAALSISYGFGGQASALLVGVGHD